MKIPYGYYLNEAKELHINREQANTVKLIYDLYLQEKSLGGIAVQLKSNGISSPSGNEIWSRAAIDKILSNKKYIPTIISFEQFVAVRFEKEKRSNIQGNKERKTTRYNSQNVLSGLLICGECGKNYRRITRPSGEVVWRCANRVEYGSTYCNESQTVTDADVKADIIEKLGIFNFDANIIKDNIESILVDNKGNFDIEFRQDNSMTLHF